MSSSNTKNCSDKKVEVKCNCSSEESVTKSVVKEVAKKVAITAVAAAVGIPYLS